MRYYQGIWEKLKKDKVVRITANRHHHPRIIKAVTKEKWLDVGFKIEIEPRRPWMTHTSDHAILTFHLELKLDYVTEQDI